MNWLWLLLLGYYLWGLVDLGERLRQVVFSPAPPEDEDEREIRQAIRDMQCLVGPGAAAAVMTICLVLWPLLLAFSFVLANRK